MAKAQPTQETKRSPAIEDYLKVIYQLDRERGPVATSALAEHLGVASASATEMLQRLASLGLVTYTPYRGAVLTEHGQSEALRVVRRHRLVELLLVEVLGLSWEEVHAEADALEHSISPKLESCIAARLGNPTLDPHGDPIPAPDGTVPPTPEESLSGLAPGSRRQVAQVTDQDPEHLRYLAALGLVPGAVVTVRDRAPFDGPLTVDTGQAVYPLDSRLARAIRVRAIEGEPSEPRR